MKTAWQTSLVRLSTIVGIPTDRLSQIFRFLLVGGLLNLTLLIAVIFMHKSGLGYDIALLITNIFGLCLNYFLNRAFVFQNSTSMLRTSLLYAVTYASVYILQLIIYRIIFATSVVHEYIAIVITVAISAIYAYLMLEKVVFQKNRP